MSDIIHCERLTLVQSIHQRATNECAQPVATHAEDERAGMQYESSTEQTMVPILCITREALKTYLKVFDSNTTNRERGCAAIHL